MRRALLALSSITATAAAWSAFLSLDACSFDWNVTAATAESGTDASKPSDAAPSAQDGTTPQEASSPTDAGAADDGACAMLETNAATAKANAEACMLGDIGQCTTKVTDQCGCELFVRFADAGPTASYAAAVQALASSGCALGCPSLSSCPTLPVTSGCVQQGGSTSCAQ